MGSSESSEPIYFSDFVKSAKRGCKVELRHEKPLPLPCVFTMDTLTQLWLSAHYDRWLSDRPDAKSRMIRDFLDTLYCSSKAFDDLFLMLFTTPKSRNVILRDHLSGKDFLATVEDILSSALEFSFKKDEADQREEGVADFPLKTFGLCPCTRRPLYVALYLTRPDLVRLLLNCGARLPDEDVCDCHDRRRHPLWNVFEVLKTSVDNHRQRSLLGLDVLLADTPHAHPLWQGVRSLQGELGRVADDVVGKIPDLQHMARAVIRRQMRVSRCIGRRGVLERWGGLPKCLVAYVYLDDVVIPKLG